MTFWSKRDMSAYGCYFFLTACNILALQYMKRLQNHLKVWYGCAVRVNDSPPSTRTPACTHTHIHYGTRQK